MEDLGIVRRIILKCVLKKYNGSVDWIDLAQDRNNWCARLKGL